jgi:hypothetical protein
MKHMLWRFSLGLFPWFAAVLGISFPGSTFAQHTPSTEARERTALAERYATERLAVWQQRLNLEEWTVSIVISHPADLKPRTLGNIHWDAEKKTAIIRVLDPADYKIPFDDVLKDIEFTVVHELIHLELSPVLSPLQRNDANRREEEHAVNHLADALLKLDRTSQPPKTAPPPATAMQPAAGAAAAPAQPK